MRDVKHSLLSLVLVVTAVMSLHHLGLYITKHKKKLKNMQKVNKKKKKQKQEMKRKGQSKVNSNLVSLS